MGYISRIKDGVGTHLVEPTLYAVAGGTSAAYTAQIENFVPVEGVIINIKFTTSNDAAATLNVNNTGARGILYINQPIFAQAFLDNGIYSLVYTKNGANYYWEVLNDLPTDNGIEIVDMWGDS